MRRSPVRALGGRPRAGPLFRGCLETSPPAERVRAGARKDRGVVGWKEDRVKVSLGIDVACRADHRASLAGPDGEFLWSGWRFRTSPLDLEALWSKIPAGAEVQVVMEPTRNAWVPLQAWLEARGAVVVLVPPEQSADLRNYYNKHTKTDRLDSRVLARLPLLHPEGLVELLGPAWADALGEGYSKSALVVLERWADPRALRRLGRRRLTDVLVKASRGAWREPKADELLAAAEESLELWKDGGLDLDELAADIAAEVRVARSLSAEIATLEARIAPMFAAADRRPETPDDREATPPTREGDDERDVGIVASLPGLDGILGAGILARFGDFDRFHSLAGDPLVHRAGPLDRPVRQQQRARPADEGRRSGPAGGPVPRRGSPPPGRPPLRAAVPPAHRGGGQAPRVGGVHPRRGGGDPHRRLLATEGVLRPARHRRPGDHQNRGPRNRRRALHDPRRRPACAPARRQREAPQGTDGPARSEVDQSRSGVRPVLCEPYR